MTAPIVMVVSNVTAAGVDPSDYSFFYYVSDEVRHIFQLVTYVSLCGSISLFGIVSNLVNIVVFAIQGFKESINISLLGLAVADLACSLTMFWTSVCYNPLFHSLNLPIVYMDVMYVTSGCPHVCFNRVTSFITVFITLERCLCIAMPLKVKNIITPFRTKVINILMFVFTILILSPFYYVNKLVWSYNPHRNRTILGLYFTKDRHIVESISFFIHSGALSFIFLLSVTICTIVLIVKLKEKTKWRKSSAGITTSSQESVSVKDKRVVKMITLISTIFIVCYIPATMNVLLMASFPEYSITGSLQNTFFVFWAVAFVLEIVNSSVNIFVYYNMSTKYRETVAHFFVSLCNNIKILSI